MGIRCRRVQINSKHLKILVVPGNPGRHSILKTIHCTPQTTTKGSVVGRPGLDFGIHNKSLRPPPTLMNENKAGHLLDRRYYSMTPSHFTLHMSPRVVRLDRRVSLVLRYLGDIALGDRVKAGSLYRRDVPIFPFLPDTTTSEPLRNI